MAVGRGGNRQKERDSGDPRSSAADRANRSDAGHLRSSKSDRCGFVVGREGRESEQTPRSAPGPLRVASPCRMTRRGVTLALTTSLGSLWARVRRSVCGGCTTPADERPDAASEQGLGGGRSLGLRGLQWVLAVALPNASDICRKRTF